MSDAADIAATLADAGQTVTVAADTAGGYDPTTRVFSGTAYSANVKAVLLPMTPYKAQANSDIIAGDEQMLLAAVDTSGSAVTKPPVGAIVTLADGVTTYTLIAVDPLHPAGDELIYTCVVRGRK
jgi:hypothetical protein